MRTAKTSPTLSYLFLDARTGYVKIGRTTNITKRKQSLECAFPCKLKLLAVFPTSQFLEGELKFMFKDDRVSGEWFRYSNAIQAFVATHGHTARNFSEKHTGKKWRDHSGRYNEVNSPLIISRS